MWEAARVLFCDPKYLLSFSSKFVDDVRKWNEAFMGNFFDDDRWTRFNQSGVLDEIWSKLNLKKAGNTSEVKFLAQWNTNLT